MSDALKEIEQLRQEIRHHDHLYYTEARPEISDLEYDKLMKRLEALEQAHPDLITPDSPTQRVGEELLEGFQTVKHRQPMLSVENTYNEPELREFDARVKKRLGDEPFEYVVELKIDGVACALVYEAGLLVQGLTRGNGVEGDDITSNLKTIREIPLRLQTDHPPQLLEIRGEVYMTNSDLADFNDRLVQRGKQPLKNSRNGTAGSLKRKDPKECAQAPLRFFAHSVGAYEGFEVQSHTQFLERIAEYGLKPTPYVKTFSDIDAAVEHCNAWFEAAHTLDFEIDGLVLKVNDFSQRERLGMTSKSPRWVIAYKVDKYEAITKINEVSIQVGRTGVLTPVAELEPVELAGTTVKRSTLHNFDEIERLDLHVGDTIVVEKAGKIIPHVVRVEKHLRSGDEKPIEEPKRCPCDKADVCRPEGEVFLRCTYQPCPARLKQRINYFASRQAMDIEGLGEKLIDQLVDRELLQGCADIYKLTPDQLADLQRMGKRSAANVIAAIEGSKSRDLPQVICALGMPQVGKHLAEVLAYHFGSMERLMEASEEELTQIDEVGPIVAKSIRDFLNDPQERGLIEGLKAAGVNMEVQNPPEATQAAEQTLAGKTFVVTGSFPTRSRDEMHDLIKRHGGKPTSSVSKKTDYLVCGEDAGSKLTKAESLGVPVISEAELLAMLDGGSE